MGFLDRAAAWLNAIEPPQTESAGRVTFARHRPFRVTVHLLASDEAEAWTRFRRLTSLAPPEELRERVVVEELLGALYADDSLGVDEITRRIRVPAGSSKRSWRRWASRVRSGRRVRRRLRAAA